MLRSLSPYLQQLQFQNLATIWTDQDLKGGERWREEIERALDSATVSVLLISQEFLTSRFIYDEELPRILRRQLEGKLTVLPVYLSPSTVTFTTIPFADEQGSRREVLLSSFQGFGTPDRTIKELPPIQRNRRFLQLFERIQELARSASAGHPVRPPLADTALPAQTPLQSPGSDTRKQERRFSDSVAPLYQPQMLAHSTPSGVILDRHYAYTLTSYANDGMQRGSGQLSQKYSELFDVLTCSVLLFDEVYLEQHHVSSLDSNLDTSESEAFLKLFKPFSLLEDLGSPREQIEFHHTVKDDMEDPGLMPILAKYYGRRVVPAESTKELILYLNRILARARHTNNALFVRPSRMPLFRHKLGRDGVAKVCTSRNLLSTTLEIPIPRCCRLDELAALRSDPKREAVRAAVSERVRRWTQQHLANGEVVARESLEQANSLRNLATKGEFVIGFRLEVVSIEGQPDRSSRYFLVPSNE